MALGQITISAADWIAARVNDRMAIMAASSRIDEQAQLSGNAAIPPAEDSGQGQLDQRRQQRALIEAQDSYRRVAARIKSRLATRAQPNLPNPEEGVRQSAGRAQLLEGMRDTPKLLAGLLASEATDATQSLTGTKTAARAEPIFAPLDAEQKKTLDGPAAPESAGAADASGAGDKDPGTSAWESAEARADAIAADQVYRKGQWADLFDPIDKPTDHIPLKKA